MICLVIFKFNAHIILQPGGGCGMRRILEFMNWTININLAHVLEYGKCKLHAINYRTSALVLKVIYIGYINICVIQWFLNACVAVK